MTKNDKSLLGKAMLICLVCLAGVLLYVIQSPDLEIASHPSRHDPEFLANKTMISLLVGGFAVIVWGLFKFLRK